MTDNHEILRPEVAEALRAWINAWFDRAVADGFIQPPFRLDETTARRLHGYFDVGLTPGEGVRVVFGLIH